MTVYKARNTFYRIIWKVKQSGYEIWLVYGYVISEEKNYYQKIFYKKCGPEIGS